MNLRTIIKKSLPPFFKGLLQSMQRPLKEKHYNYIRLYLKENPKISELFPEEIIKQHYAGKIVRNNVFHPDLYLNQIRYFRLYEYFLDHYPVMFEPSERLLYAGDSSGILLKAMNQKGVSVDINAESVKEAKSKGLEAYEASIYELPFPDKFFDYSMSFQCLEHLEAPLLALKELERVTKERIFISIPYQDKTKIYPKEYWLNRVQLPQEEGGWDVKEINEHCDFHIFELSSQDFKSLLSYTNLICEHNYPINYFEKIGASMTNKGTYFNFFDLKVRKKQTL